MKFLLLTALMFVGLTQVLAVNDVDLYEWENFKVEHMRNYESLQEEEKRKGIFLDNLKFIREHNKKFENGEETFTVGVNKYADMTNEEFRRQMNGFRGEEADSAVSSATPFSSSFSQKSLPDTVDWRTSGAVTPIKDQGSCGSCWAFSTTGSVEGQHYLSKKKLVSLSEQNLVDCTAAKSRDGCGGGLMSDAFQYIIRNNGIDTESSYRYVGVNENCKFQSSSVGATISSYVNITSGDEDSLKEAVATIGPISGAMDGGPVTFQFYKSGVYHSIFCYSKLRALDHGILVIGYGFATKGGDYWLVKNSWGTSWGMEGYFMIKRGSNMCGIATCCSYPQI